MNRRIISCFLAGTITGLLLTGCGNSGNASGPKLDPNNPVSLTIWHYYNGAQQAAFDELVSEFNATVGNEKGIFVEEYSKGSVSDLEKAVSDAVAETVGADPLPDLFSTYADTAYAVQKEGKLADLSKYFSSEELEKYVPEYIQEGYISGNDELYLFPIAKSTEIMMINTTDWQPFADATGYKLDDLSTIEGVVEVAQSYYEWTDSLTPDVPNDGKAFYGRDSMANYFIINLKQLGTEIFNVKNGEVKINADKQQLRRLWDNYYVPYVNGYFASFGKFRSDDVKTGEIIAYTGSSSSSMYFPDMVMTDEESREIDFAVLPAPGMAGGENINVQQGASMAVTKSDELHEYAACEFLRWFTQKENNLRFVCESAYLPVTEEANSLEALQQVIDDNGIEVNEKAYACLESIITSFDETTFYSTESFDNGYATRQVLEYHLSDKAAADRAAIDAAVESGISREEAVSAYVTDDAFDKWYSDFCSALYAKAFG